MAAGEHHPPTPDPHELLRAFLAARGGYCPRCRYDLRGLTSDVCPECRVRLYLTVGTPDPPDGMYMSAMILNTVGIATSVFLMLFALLFAAPWGVGEGVLLLLLLAGSLAALHVGVAVALVRKRRAYWRMTRRAQGWVAAGIGSLTLLPYAFVFLLFLLG